jgi:hypothetical protein
MLYASHLASGTALQGCRGVQEAKASLKGMAYSGVAQR